MVCPSHGHLLLQSCKLLAYLNYSRDVIKYLYNKIICKLNIPQTGY